MCAGMDVCGVSVYVGFQSHGPSLFIVESILTAPRVKDPQTGHLTTGMEHVDWKSTFFLALVQLTLPARDLKVYHLGTSIALGGEMEVSVAEQQRLAAGGQALSCAA